MDEKRMKTRSEQRRRGTWPLLFMLALVLALFAVTGSAAAIDVLDQQQTQTNGGFAMLNGPIPVVQSFTAGHTAPLGKISVYIGGYGGAYLMRAEIWSSSGILGATELTVPNGDNRWQDITFTPAPTLTAGTQYSIVLRWVGNTFVWLFGAPNPYSGGAASWNAGWDMCFKTYYYVADTTPPVITPPANVTADAPSSAGVAVNFASASATDDVDGTLPASAIHYYTDYGTASQAEVHSGDTFPIGTTTVTAAAADSSGNIGTATFTITVWTDTTPPVVTPPSNITVEATGAAGAEASFGSASASDNVDGAMPATSIHYYTGYGTDDQVEVHSGDLFPIGTTTVTVAATDTHNNIGTATFTVSVVDTTSPVLTVPADITVGATGPAGATVTFSVSATDVVDGAVTPRTAPVSGVTFPIGEITVWVSATDSAGNTSADTFLVTVLGPTGMLDALAGTIAEASDDPTAPGGIAPIIAESLLAKVNAALAALQRGNKNDAKVAMNDLKALINEVQAQTSKSISPEAAAAIIAAANGLIDMLSAPAPTLPMTTGAFAGPDNNDTVWQVQVNVVGSAFDPENPYNTLAAGTMSFAASQTLPDGTEVEKAFTMTVDCHYSIDYFPSGDLVDAGAAVGICGFVVASTGGEGVPAVGDYYLFLAWDGAQGYQNPDGTMGYYPDTWTFAPWGGASYMRNFQRTIIAAWSTYGSSSYVGSMNLWPVTEGDISVTGGMVLPV
ncbi:MAG: HYR domain-containing protein [Thermoleophilia bacterium]|nr:HYR domain-containing protein [Thermoleophilia bacterium]